MSHLEQLTQILDSRAWVELAWLYGSRATGRARPESDYDLAIVVNETQEWNELQRLREDLEDAVSAEVGLALLNGADSLLCHEAICGQLLLCRDSERHASFVSRVSRLHEDDQIRLEHSLQTWSGKERAT